MRMINNGDETKISSSIKDFSFHGATFEQLKASKTRNSVRLFCLFFVKFDKNIFERFLNHQISMR
jgi:hypothetical protein